MLIFDNSFCSIYKESPEDHCQTVFQVILSSTWAALHKSAKLVKGALDAHLCLGEHAPRSPKDIGASAKHHLTSLPHLTTVYSTCSPPSPLKNFQWSPGDASPTTEPLKKCHKDCQFIVEFAALTCLHLIVCTVGLCIQDCLQ